ncbi:MAG: MBL fold metallo-hydrolase [Actinomycetia bacterium]|nr:MBL fold metallo-hydrolase [Actinomycetes bacterium]
MTTTLDWYGCATFRLNTGGQTIMLDAYIDRAANAEGPGLVADDIEHCDWIVIGHSHFDHLYGAERIAINTGATIIGSYETVRIMEAQGVPLDQLICVAGGERIDLGGGAFVSVFPSQHSCVWTHGKMDQADEVCIGDLRVTLQERNQRLAGLIDHIQSLGPEVASHLAAASQGDRGDGGALVYLFDLPDGRVFYQDTSGHWTGIMHDLRPDVAILAAAGRGTIDGEPIQGSLAQFVARQADLLRPAKIVLGHHDNWLPGFSVPTNTAPVVDAIAAMVPGAVVLAPGYVEATEILP